MKYSYIGLLALSLSGVANSAVINLTCNMKMPLVPAAPTTAFNVSFSPDKKTFTVNDGKLTSVSVNAGMVSGQFENAVYKLDRLSGELTGSAVGGGVMFQGPCAPAGKTKF